MTFPELRALIGDDAYASRFPTLRAYRTALLLASGKQTIEYHGDARERERIQQDLISDELRRLKA